MASEFCQKPAGLVILISDSHFLAWPWFTLGQMQSVVTFSTNRVLHSMETSFGLGCYL